jgi:tetratricopeptide (TPR) repeat protein
VMAVRATRVWLWVSAAMAGAVLVILAENLGAPGVNRLLLYLPGADKVMHLGQSALIFAVLYFCLRPVPLARGARVAIAVGLALCLALFDEWQQGWMGGRNVELADLVAGGAGVLLGLGFMQRSQWGRGASFCIAAAIAAGSLVAYESYSRTKDYNWGLLAEERADLVSARRHFLDALNSGMKTASLYNELAWTEVESGVGDASQAVEYAERGLAIRPGDAAALDTYGWALHRAGRSKEALGPLSAALQKAPRMYCIHYHLGAAYLGSGDLPAARTHFQRQIDEQPHTKEAELAAELLQGLSGRLAG